MNQNHWKEFAYSQMCVPSESEVKNNNNGGGGGNNNDGEY